MHGNVNEWCWDYYGAYDPDHADNPTGPAFGTRHVYRGGGWNDFAKTCAVLTAPQVRKTCTAITLVCALYATRTAAV